MGAYISSLARAGYQKLEDVYQVIDRVDTEVKTRINKHLSPTAAALAIQVLRTAPLLVISNLVPRSIVTMAGLVGVASVFKPEWVTPISKDPITLLAISLMFAGRAATESSLNPFQAIVETGFAVSYTVLASRMEKLATS